MSRPNRHVPQLTRRQVMRLAAAGALAALGLRLDRGPGGRHGRAPEPPQVVHPALDVRRPEPDRHLRPQARPRQQRPVQADRDGGAGDAPRPAPAEARPPGEGPRHHPLDEHQGRATTAGPPTTSGPATCPRARSATRRSARWSPRSSTTSRPSCRASSASRRSGRSTRPPSARASSARSAPR